MSLEDEELLKGFLIESQQNLADVKSQLRSIEGQVESIDVQVVHRAFRAIHSIKGAAGFLGLTNVATLANKEEEVLHRIRSQGMRPTSTVISTLIQATDRLMSLLDSYATSNQEDVSDWLASLQALMIAQETQTTGQPEPIPVIEDSDENAHASPNSNQSTPSISPHETIKGVEQTSGISAEALREFLIESHDNLEQLERDLVCLERDPASERLLHSIFRNVHTIKGTAGFLAYAHVEQLTHAGENLLGALRSGQLALDAELSTALFAMIDQVRKYLANIEATGKEGGESGQALIDRLNQLLAERMGRSDDSASTNRPCVALPLTLPKERTAAPTPSQTISTAPPSNAELLPVVPSAEASHSTATDSTIRVDVALLDKLMTRVGELVLARNQILQFTSTLGDSDLLNASQRLNLITTELQEGVMKTRMQPIGNVWSKFPRLVRDLAAICGKEVRIEMDGKETELDKTIIEAIKDPLTHLVRNTVDHGIETPDVRVQKGKPMEGCLYLRAYHEGGQVNIEISDDGAGLNLERIRAKAVERGLITPEQASRLPDREVGQLIFLPGFSTAETVSNVSGRGVGMDVVKTNIEKIGGTVDLQSRPNEGTTIKIKIPLTLAIIPALIVSNDGNRFAIPQVNLLELVRLEGEQAIAGIEWIHGTPVYRLRGRLLPLVYLSSILKTKKHSTSPSESINIVVLRADERQFGLVVDRINDTEEIVVKPLCNALKGIPVYSGATIMGDGKVALILDVLGIAESSHAHSKSKVRNLGEVTEKVKESNLDQVSLLILGLGEQQRVAIPISQVARLERIPKDHIELAAGEEVVQYREEILPIVYLSSLLGSIREDSEDTELNVVVYTKDQRSIGIVVDQVLDTVETSLGSTLRNASHGRKGSYVIQGYVTDLIDLPKLLEDPHATSNLVRTHLCGALPC